jgi:integrase
VIKVHAVLRLVLGHAVSNGHLRVNPAVGVRVASPPKQEMLILTIAQVQALGANMPPPLDLLVRFAAFTGLRAGESHALRRSDIDFRRGVVIVARSGSTHGNPATEVSTTKTGRVRTVGLPAFLQDELRAHLLTRPIHPNALIFVMPGDGSPVRHSNLVRRYFKPAVQTALPPELHGLRWHDLRHTAAALAIQEGAHPKAIQARMGHSTIRTTLDVYGHLFPGLDEALAAGLDAARRASTTQVGGNAGVTVLGKAP